MNDVIDKAIALRSQGEHNKSKALLQPLLANTEFSGKAHLHIACVVRYGRQRIRCYPTL